MKNILVFLSCAILCVGIQPVFILCESVTVLKKEIFEAAKKGDTHVFVELIKQNANFNMEDADGNTLFHLAAEHGHGDIIELLADYDNDQDSVFVWIKRLLSGPRKPDINAKNKLGKTALHSSIESDDLESLLMIVWKGGDTGVCNKNYETPLLYAVEKGKKEHALYLMNVCDNYYCHATHTNDTILHRALACKHQDLAKGIITFNDEICAYDSEMGGNNFLLKAKNNKGETALLYSAKTYNQEILKLLLSGGSEDIQSMLNEPDQKNCTPFVYICYQKNVNEIEDLFLRHKPHLNRKTSFEAMPLFIVLNHGDYARSEKLIRHGADINMQDRDHGDTLLHAATYANDRQAIDWLLRQNASLAIRNKVGYDSMDVAIRRGYENLLPLFIAHGSDVDRVDQKGQTRLMIEVSRGNNDLVARLIELKANVFFVDNTGQNVLHKAAASNNKKGSEIVLRKNKNIINYQDKDGNTPLHFAADSKVTSDLVSLYLSSGADVNSQNISGEAPIHRAAAAGNAASINYLKNNKSSLASLAKGNNSPAHYALINGRFECLSLLLDKRIINTINQDRKTIMSLAIEKGVSKERLQEIITYGTDLLLCPDQKSGDTYLHCALNYNNNDALMYVMTPKLINQRNNFFTSPLSCAVQNKNIYAVQQLLQKRAFVNIPDNNGWTEAHHAAAIEGERLLEMLCQSGSSHSKRTGNGSTSLHIAAQYNRVKNINYLKKIDDNVDREDDNGNIAFEIAVRHGHVEATKALLCEKYFINGKAQRALCAIQPSFFKSNVQIYLEQEINKRDRDCNGLIDMQNQLTTLIKMNQVSSSLLRQKAVKDNVSFYYEYKNNYGGFVSYSLDFFKKSYQSDRNSHYEFLKKAIDYELAESEQLKKCLALIDANNAQKDREEQQAIKQIKVEKSTVAKQETTANQEDKKSSDAIEAECTMCAESKKDAQRRCTNSKCSAILCDDCVNSYMKSKSACLYCFNSLEK